MAEGKVVVARGASSRLAAHWRVPLYRNAYALTMSAAATSGLGMAYWVLAARLYPADTVGKSSAVISTITFLQVVAILSLDGALMRFVPRAAHALSRLVAYSLALCVFTGLLVSVAFLAGVSLWSPSLNFLNSTRSLEVGFVFLTIGSGLFMVQDGALTGLRQAPWVLAKNASFSFLKIVLLVIFARTLRSYGILSSWTASILIILVPFSVLLFARLIPSHMRFTRHLAEELRFSQLSKYVAGNYLASLLAIASLSLMPIVVLHQAGSAANAHFYLPWLVSNSLRLVPTNMSASLVVEGAIDQKSLGAHGRHALMHSLRLMLPASVLLLLLSPLLLSFFGPGYARDGTPLLRLLAVAEIPTIITILYVGLARVRQQVARIVMLQSILTTASVGFSYALLPSFGITVVGIVWLATQGTAAVFLLVTELRTLLWPPLNTAETST